MRISLSLSLSLSLFTAVITGRRIKGKPNKLKIEHMVVAPLKSTGETPRRLTVTNPEKLLQVPMGQSMHFFVRFVEGGSRQHARAHVNRFLAATTPVSMLKRLKHVCLEIEH